MTNRVDPFTRRRLERFVETFRSDQGQLPTLQDFEKSGFPRDLINRAEREEILEKLYVTLTDGSIRKGYTLKQH